jgi:CRP-like cAMP-binding protein
MARPSADTIARVPLFAEFERRELERLADAFKERRLSAGDAVATEGQKGAGFFVIGDGTATVTADTDMTCYGMTFWEFRPFVESDARVAWKLLQALAKKLRAVEQRETT